MKRILTLACALCAVAPLAAAGERVEAPAKPRIGVYDSRLVALAYYNSDEHKQLLQQLKTDAVAASALQELQHYQVFSNASIPNVMEKLSGVLPAVAKDAGVSVIVSKWELAIRGDDVEYVDVTDALVKTLHPDAKVQKWIADMKTKDPVPLLQLVMQPHK
jgi:hypothetical protein